MSSPAQLQVQDGYREAETTYVYIHAMMWGWLGA